MRTLQQYILEEMPRHYTGEVTYQKPTKFAAISTRNVEDYVVLAEYNDLIFLVHPQQTYGFVFKVEDLQSGKQSVVPVLHLSLRDTPVKGYKQAFNLRIQESYSKLNVASAWYAAYVERFGGIVSDKEHLQGGKLLWKSFIKTATTSEEYNVSLVNYNTGEVIIDTVTAATPDSVIWSQNDELKDNVLVYEYQPT